MVFSVGEVHTNTNNAKNKNLGNYVYNTSGLFRLCGHTNDVLFSVSTKGGMDVGADVLTILSAALIF